MAHDARRPRMSRANDRLIAIDGVNGNAMTAAAKSRIAAEKRRRVGISYWDASGIFGEVVVAEDAAGRPSARTLLLLYAADLAFRLRWEIKPALDEGLVVVAVPYVDTAIAFGRAAGPRCGLAGRHVQLRAEARRTKAGLGAGGTIDFRSQGIRRVRLPADHRLAFRPAAASVDSQNRIASARRWTKK